MASSKHKDYFEILGVDRKASQAEIKKAYRRLARKYHPDVNPDDPAAAEKFKEINEAFQVLSDPEKRKQYEQFGRVFGEGAGPQAGNWGPGGFQYQTYTTEDLGDLNGLFEHLFGAGFTTTGKGGRRRTKFGFDFGQPQPQKGRDIEADLTLTLEEAAKGTQRELELTLQEQCTTCGGTGQGVNGLCPACKGSGFITRPKRLKVRVPAGVTEGSKVRLAGQGAPGANGGPNGDLYLRIHLAPHKQFKVEGRDLYVSVPVTFKEAALGAEVSVPTLTGNVKLRIPAGTQGGQKFRLKGRGLPGRGKTPAGDLYATVNIKVPKRLSDKQRKLLEALDESD